MTRGAGYLVLNYVLGDKGAQRKPSGIVVRCKVHGMREQQLDVS